MLCSGTGMMPSFQAYSIGFTVARRKDKDIHSNGVQAGGGLAKTPFAFGVLLCALVIVLIVFAALAYHFFIGGDIPFLKLSNHESAQYWGQLGDFAGGLLNPILSFLALMAVLKTLTLQRAEMAAAQVEARAANLEQRVQSNLYSRQAFETTFFGLLDVHSRILSDICFRADRPVKGREAVDTMLAKLKASNEYQGAILFPELTETEDIQRRIDDFCLKYKSEVGHYFRNLYWILKKIDSSRLGLDSEEESKDERFRERRIFFDYLRRRQYASLVRAQLSEGELALLQLNCLGPYGEGLKFYVEKYSLLKSLDQNFFGGWSEYINNRFHPLATKSSSKLALDDVKAFIVSNVMFRRLRAKAGAIESKHE
ncbi:putative phage abortive infection protein [Pseudomonas sp. NPDC090592]|uniref:putative phage abortive infection protein n=1 Tax=Pseudomonas sp. NPDC090592 TaxID=3364480 RepID=UPI00383B28D8